MNVKIGHYYYCDWEDDEFIIFKLISKDDNNDWSNIWIYSTSEGLRTVRNMECCWMPDSYQRSLKDITETCKILYE